MNIPKGTYNVLRSVVVTALVAVVTVIALGYLLLLLPPVQQQLCERGEQALGEYLNTNVDIGSVSVMPFNQLELRDVLVNDQQGDSLLHIDKLGAGISLKQLLTEHRIVITHGEIIGLEGHVTRPDKSSPTNMQFIIDAFKPKEDKGPRPFDVQVKTVVVRRSALTYDVLDQPHKPGRFDANHLSISNLKADLSLPRLKNDDFDIRVKRLAFDEHSGFSLQRLSTDVHITATAMDVTDIKMKLPGSDLRLDDLHLEYSSLKDLGSELPHMPLRVGTTGSTVTPADFAAFVPQLKKFNTPFRLTAAVERNGSRIAVPALSLHSSSGDLSLNLRGSFMLPEHGHGLAVDLNRIDLDARAGEVASVTSLLASLSPQARNIINRCGNITLDGELHAAGQNMRFKGDVGTSLGNANLDGTLTQHKGALQFDGYIKTPGLKLGTLLDKRDVLDEVALDAQVDATLRQGDLSGHLSGHIPFVDIKGMRYHDITADVEKQGKDYMGTLVMNDPNGRLNLDGKATLDGENSTYEVAVSTQGLNLSHLGLVKKFPDHRLDLNATAAFWGNTLDNARGLVELENVTFADNKGQGMHIDSFRLSTDNDGQDRAIDINTDHVKGSISGQYDFKTIVPTVKHMLSQTFPQYFGNYTAYTHTGAPNNVQFDFVVTPDDELNEMLKLPVYPFYRYSIKGQMSESDNTFEVTLDAPFMKQGNKFITGTHLVASIDSVTNQVVVNARSIYPLKNGINKLNLALNLSGLDNRLDGNLDWWVKADETDTVTARKFHGNLNLSALLDRSTDGSIKADVTVNPSQMVFNDTVWEMEKGRIAIDRGDIMVDNLAGGHGGQFIRINGMASHDPADSLCLELNDVNLDYIFETLAIDHVSFGGRATSKIVARNVFSPSPAIYTPSLFIDDISYNGAVMGDADLSLSFDTGTQGVLVTGDIAQANGRTSTLAGGIYIAEDSLYIEFDTDHANAAFLKPYMEAFTSDVQGEMSGKAILFGNFHTINLAGDIVADTMRFLIDYVKCYYTASNVPVHIVPDWIEFNDIPIHDREGHEARLGGWLKHDAFHRPEFHFAITNARNFLCYDTSPADNPRWYGTIYGNGTCLVDGGPGVVHVNVSMNSAPRSKFTYVLSDDEQADEYHFITFRDRNAPPPTPFVRPNTSETAWILSNVGQIKHKETEEEAAEPSAYFINLEGNITPDVALTVVMDPVGGDEIKATGSGNMRLTYNNNEELEVYGTYKLEKGTYKFTLQDFIIKDFTIQDGSSIRFQGDPYKAELDLEAAYTLNANLKDLDDSFGMEKQQQKRTNVPVQAMLYARGIISQPTISFDLKFPTITSEYAQRVKSIISTDEMMNRQIIYLLALNRFYTPDYMDTKMNQNEVLTSVASSTISGQLSNMLGKIADNLSIAPNIRTDKGDFSDMEVDVALSSQLLNNRLLINGNLGYRDNAYTMGNTNTNFIGDFDIEYLLNSKGTFRLKAYNHFNDQNYYLRDANATTTQGVGIVWKHDFDNITTKKRSEVKPAADSIPHRTPSPASSRDSAVRQPVPMVTLRPAAAQGDSTANPASAK